MARAENAEDKTKDNKKYLASNKGSLGGGLIEQKSLNPKKSKISTKNLKESSKRKMSPTSKTAIKNNQKQKENLIKSKKRVKKFGEVFTPEFIVKQMCDLCEPTISQVDKKVFEPTCGNGNFLVEILNRKLNSVPDFYTKIKKQKNARSKKAQVEIYEFCLILAISNVYAVDIQEDNVEESRERLKEIIYKHIKNIKNSFFFLETIDKILSNNIIVGNTLTQKNELKFFDLKPNFEDLTFEISEHSLQDIEKAYSKIKSANLENLTDVMSQMRASPSKLTPKKTRLKVANKKD
ncbi:MAG: SAM-dependent methyltransferase [Candidatus Saccharimonas sp.]|nr:MAG: SAM-dependent methyltransferase [Candidatus Saccharimonas sp.]